MPDGRYRGVVVETDAQMVSDADTVRTFHMMKRSSAVWVALITGFFGVLSTYLLTHAAPTNCATTGDMNAAQKSISELSSAVATLTTTIAKNADHAHNETSELSNRVDSNARDTQQTIARLSDKLDIFMRTK